MIMRTRRLTTTLLTSLTLTAVLALAPSAYAGYVHKYITQITEVPAAPGVTSGSFGGPNGGQPEAPITLGLATDSSTLYVLDASHSTVDEFNTTTNTFTKQVSGVNGTASIAVDQATGEIYIGNGGVEVVSGTGEHLNSWNGSDTPSQGFGSAAVSVAVDNSTSHTDPAAGDVYVAASSIVTGQLRSLVDVFKPEASGQEKYVTELSGIPREPTFGYAVVDMIAVNDTNGDLIIGTGRKNVVWVFKPTAPGRYELLFELTNANGVRFRKSEEQFTQGAIVGVAADGSSGDFYVADKERDAVYEFAANGEYLSEIAGTPGGPFGKLAGIAVGSNGDLYVADEGTHAVDVFGPNIDLPEVSTNPQPGQAASVTLSGTVNPAGTKVTACRFEFGLSNSYGSQVPCSSYPASGSSPVGVSASLPASGLAPGSIYHYRLAVGDEEGETVYSQDETFVTAPSVVGSVLASEITSFSATLTGVINPGNVSPGYRFLYGMTSAYGSVWPEGGLAGAGVGSQQTVSQTLTGLTPDTTYHVALNATNFGGGESASPDATFTTRPLVPPVVSTSGAEALGQTSATLTGSVDPEGLPSTYRFEYGTSTGYGSAWPVLQVYAGSASTSEMVAIGVPNLSPGTTYHYRLVASNEDGTTYGVDESFTTPSYPAALVQEPPGFTQTAGETSKVGSKSSKPSFKSHKHKPGKRRAKSRAKRRRGGRR
jgi:NHL repeat